MCLFCRIINKELEANIVFEDEMVIGFLDNDPINEGHILLVPKEHVLDIDELSDELLQHIMIVLKKITKVIKSVYNPSGYSIMQNGGKFNDIGHYHLHIFPRYHNDGFGWTSLERQFDISTRVSEKIKFEGFIPYKAVISLVYSKLLSVKNFFIGSN